MSNVCLHRGRQLKDYDGRCSELRCPYHGFSWQIDGRLKHIPARWDFLGIDAREWSLPEAKVDTWAGFVFINPDPDAAPLAEMLGDMPKHFERWNLKDRYVQAHVAKTIPANWKIVQEAFSESFHAWDDPPPDAALSWRRQQPGRHLGHVQPDHHRRRYRQPAAAAERRRTRSSATCSTPASTRTRSSRCSRGRQLARRPRRWLGIGGGRWSATWSMIGPTPSSSTTSTTRCSRTSILGAPDNRIVYRFRPNGDDHRSAIMEVFFLAPFSGERPPPAECHRLEIDEPWTNVPESGCWPRCSSRTASTCPRSRRG